MQYKEVVPIAEQLGESFWEPYAILCRLDLFLSPAGLLYVQSNVENFTEPHHFTLMDACVSFFFPRFASALASKPDFLLVFVGVVVWNGALTTAYAMWAQTRGQAVVAPSEVGFYDEGILLTLVRSVNFPAR